MNVTLIKNGCNVTTSNGLTARLVNNYRCQGFTCLPQVKFNGCAIDGTSDELDRLVVGDPTLWPWYDPNDEASKEYLGTFVNNVDGLQSSTMTRDVTSTVGGAVAAVCKNGEREVIVSGFMFALSERGMAYGRRWEQHRWWSGSCECHDTAVSFRVDCPTTLDPNEGLIELNRVVTTAGPKYTNFHQSGKCCDSVARFEVTLKALDSAFYGPSLPVAHKVFDPSQFVYESWECDIPEHVCGAECCSSCRSVILDGFFDIDTNCCYCRPLMVSRECFAFPGVPLGSRRGFDFEFYSGEAVLENARVLFVDGSCDTDCYGNADEQAVFYAFELNRISPNSRVRINGKTGRVDYDCGFGWQQTPGLVFDAGGLPFTNGRVDSCRPFSVVVEVDAGTVADDAWVAIRSFDVNLG